MLAKIKSGGYSSSFSGNTAEKVMRKLVSAHQDKHKDSLLKRIRRYRKYLAYKPTKPDMEPDIELVLHGVSGYNLIRYFHKYYAIPQSEGAFVPEKMGTAGYSSSYSGNTADKLLRKIASATKEAKQTAPTIDNGPPQLLMDGFLGFNIIYYRGEVYAILQSEGAFDYDKILSKGYSKAFSGQSLSKVQVAISQSIKTRKAVSLTEINGQSNECSKS